MISKEHKDQHQNTFIHANEIGIWGIGCSAMQKFYDFFCEANPDYKIGYYDVKHNEVLANKSTTLSFNNVELQLNETTMPYQLAQFFNTADMVIINGNHHHAKKMILILDGKKEFKPNIEHLKKTNIVFYNEQTISLAKELRTMHPSIELLKGTDFENINCTIKNSIKQKKAALIGLILAGGESKRMKQNKSLITYHDQPQWLHLYQLLQSKCEQIFVSTSAQNAHLYQTKPLIIDTLIGYGPLSGILSALLSYRHNAILVIACDLPLLDEMTINQLITERDETKMATTFLNPESNFLEPLITIYEPKALPVMLAMLAQGYTCPRKMLIQNDVKIVKPIHTSALKNINHPQERDQVFEILKKSESL